MKILLWGIYSPWTMNFVEHFLIKSDYEIWTFNRGNQDEYKKYINFYKEKGVHLIEFPKLVSDVFDGKGRENYFKVLYSRLLKIKTILKEGPFDLISMQFVDYMDIAAVKAYVTAHPEIDYFVIGADDPLAIGLVDELEAMGKRCFGPRKNAAVIEASKAFAKELMKKYKITAAVGTVIMGISSFASCLAEAASISKK